MSRLGTALSSGGFVLGVAIMLSASDQRTEAQRAGTNAPAAGAPSSIPMGGNKSVTRFFVTSKGLGKGGDLGGLAGADAHCQVWPRPKAPVTIAGAPISAPKRPLPRPP
jgi:hypothetical protein